MSAASSSAPLSPLLQDAAPSVSAVPAPEVPFNPVSAPGLSAFTSYSSQPPVVTLPSPVSTLSGLSSPSADSSGLPSPPTQLSRDATVAEVSAAIAALSSSTAATHPTAPVSSSLIASVEERRHHDSSLRDAAALTPTPPPSVPVLLPSPPSPSSSALSSADQPPSHIIDITPADDPPPTLPPNLLPPTSSSSSLLSSLRSAEAARAELHHQRRPSISGQQRLSVSQLQSAVGSANSQEEEEEERWLAHSQFFQADAGQDWPRPADVRPPSISLMRHPQLEVKESGEASVRSSDASSALLPPPAGSSHHHSLTFEPSLDRSPSVAPTTPSPDPSPHASASLRSEERASPAPTPPPTREQLQMQREGEAQQQRLVRRATFAPVQVEDEEVEEEEEGVEDGSMSRSSRRVEMKEDVQQRDAAARAAHAHAVRSAVKTADAKERERKEREKRREREKREKERERERRWLSKEFQDRIGAFPRGLLHATLACLLASPHSPNVSNLSSNCLLPAPQHVLLDLSALPPHHSAPSSSLPDEMADALSSLLGLSTSVLSCDADTQLADLFYARREEEKYAPGSGGGGANPWRSTASIASSQSSSAAYTGPLFSSICVLHNVHMSSCALQSTLVQAMRVKQVTIDGTLVNLPRIHLIIATHSTHIPLPAFPASPLPRHLLEQYLYDVVLDVGFPVALRTFMVTTQSLPPQPPLPYMALLPSLEAVTVSHVIQQYVHDVIITLRQHVRLSFGPSPAAAQSLVVAAVAAAMMAGQGYVTPHEVDGVAETVLAHRVVMRSQPGRHAGGGGGAAAGKAGRGSARSIIHHLVTKALMPPK